MRSPALSRFANAPGGMYLSFGVPFVWVIDPRLRRGATYTKDGMRAGLFTEDPEIRVEVAEFLD